MRRRLDLGVRLHDLAIGTDQVRDALRVLRRARIVRVVDLAELVVEREQLVRVVELLAKLLVVAWRIEARAEDDDVLRFKLADSITESVALERSTRGVGHRIEPQQDVLPCEV